MERVGTNRGHSVDAITLIPDPHLMESMRAVGYNLETAIADLVDNSITAGADRVDILFSAETDPYVATATDGTWTISLRLSPGASFNCQRKSATPCPKLST